MSVSIGHRHGLGLPSCPMNSANCSDDWRKSNDARNDVAWRTVRVALKLAFSTTQTSLSIAFYSRLNSPHQRVLIVECRMDPRESFTYFPCLSDLFLHFTATPVPMQSTMVFKTLFITSVKATVQSDLLDDEIRFFQRAHQEWYKRNSNWSWESEAWSRGRFTLLVEYFKLFHEKAFFNHFFSRL